MEFAWLAKIEDRCPGLPLPGWHARMVTRFESGTSATKGRALLRRGEILSGRADCGCALGDRRDRWRGHLPSSSIQHADAMLIATTTLQGFLALLAILSTVAAFR